MHACEGEMVCESVNPKVPYFNAPIYLENKTPIGKVDEVLGPINQVYFTIKPQEGIVATSFKPGDKVYIGGDKLLPLEKYVLHRLDLHVCVTNCPIIGSFPSLSPLRARNPRGPSVAEVVLLAEAPEVDVVHLVVAEAPPEDVEDLGEVVLVEAASVVGAEVVAEEDLVVVVEVSDDRQFVLTSTVLLWRYGKTGALAGTFFFEIFYYAYESLLLQFLRCCKIHSGVQVPSQA
jgi:rRNA processing protein Gar1